MSVPVDSIHEPSGKLSFRTAVVVRLLMLVAKIFASDLPEDLRKELVNLDTHLRVHG